MDIHEPGDFAVPVPTLPPGVVEFDGLPRCSWNTRAVTLTNEAGDDVAKGVIQNVDTDFVWDLNGEPLGEDRVAVQIAQSLNEEEAPSVWMWSIHSWHIKRVILNGFTLYDHEQNHIYKMAVQASGRRVRAGVRPYETTRVRTETNTPPRKETLLTTESIAAVATKECCPKNCCQHFPRREILPLRSNLHVKEGVYNRKKCLLEVHRQMHKDNAGNDCITLKSRGVCPTAWWIIHGISKATFYRFKSMANDGKEAEGHGNLGSKKPRKHTLQATATLKTLIEPDADRMPHKSVTLDSGEKVTAMVLPSAFRWRDQLPKVNAGNATFNLPPISSSGLSNIRRTSFPEYAPKARGDTFARCGTCDRYRQLKSACTPSSSTLSMWDRLLNTHLESQRAHRMLYYSNRYISEMYPEKMLTIIHDKMDHSKTASPHFSHKTKATDCFMKMPVAVTGMIAHGHGDIRYAHYGLNIFPTDSNHTIGSIARLLRHLEEEPKNVSHKLFEASGTQSKLTKAVLQGSEICLDSLVPQRTPQEDVPPPSLPPVLTLQLDNASGDNKNRWVFAFCSLLVLKGVFREIMINFLIVGHTHEDIDALFGRWSTKLKTNDYPTIPRLMKSFMDCETQPVIPHFIEEVPDFKQFVQGYLGTSGDYLEGHSKAQQFKFHMDSEGWPIMEYKNVCNEVEWLPKGGKGIRLWSATEDGRPNVPTGDPRPLPPHPMKALLEIKKGLSGLLGLWKEMADAENSGEFRSKNESLVEYWTTVRVALDEPLEARAELKDGFWPKSEISLDDSDRRQEDGSLQEGQAEDVAFVGLRKDRPRPSFRVDKDTHAGYMVAVRPADGDPKPFWLARAITAPSPDPGHRQQIQIQYWTPASGRHINMDSYEGWDTKEGNVWREDFVIPAAWSNTDCLMTAWKPRGKRIGDDQPQAITKVSIPKTQIGIIKDSVAAFESQA